MSACQPLKLRLEVPRASRSSADQATLRTEGHARYVAAIARGGPMSAVDRADSQLGLGFPRVKEIDRWALCFDCFKEVGPTGRT